MHTISTFVALLGLALHGVYATESASAANPIRKVVNMLQLMSEKIEKEGEKEEALFKKFQCYCKTGGGTLEEGIAALEQKIPELESSIEEDGSKHAQLTEDLKAHKADRSAAKKAVAEATAIREKEAAAYAEKHAEATADIEALAGAEAAIAKGMGESFLQTNTAAQLRKVVSLARLSDVDRDDVLAFLSQGESNGYAPASGQILGIIKQLKEEMQKDDADATSDEDASIKDFEALVGAKKKEIAALTSAIETKTQRVGELAVGVTQVKQALEDATESLAEDKKFLADLGKMCEEKAKQWEEIQKTRAEELLALAETIKVLNDDDALDLFKKTLPSASASFVQIQVTEKATRSRAIEIVDGARKWAKSPGLDFVALALRGKKVGFEKVLKMIDSMVGILKEEQVSDNKKKEQCAADLDRTDDEKKALVRLESDTQTAIEDAKASIESLKEEITALTAGIKALDKSVAEATAQRKDENADFKELMQSDTTAKELLKFAKNRLNKFYNPKLYKPVTQAPLSEEDQIVVNMGGTLAPTPPPGGIAGTGIGFVQIRAHKSREAPPPPPETFGAYKKKGEDSGGVIAMIDLLIKDLDKEMTQAKTEEKNAQEEYEQLMKDSAEKRAEDAKTLQNKESAKASTEENLSKHEGDLKETQQNLMATEEEISALHGACDWLMQHFDVRKEARDNEIDALQKAKAVLSGADYSFMQSSKSVRLRGSK